MRLTVDVNFRDAGFEESKHPRGADGQFGPRKVVQVGSVTHIETPARSGNYRPVKQYGVFKHNPEGNYHLSQMLKDFNDSHAAGKHADALWKKTGEPHVVRTNHYVDKD